jgi:hypothetical protein
MNKVNNGSVKISSFDNWMDNQKTFEEEKGNQIHRETKLAEMTESNKTYQTSTREDPFWKQYGPSLKQYNDLPNKLPNGTWKPHFNEWYMKELKLHDFWLTNGSFPSQNIAKKNPPVPINLPPKTNQNVKRPENESIFYQFDHQPQINQQWLDYGKSQIRNDPSQINNIQLRNFLNGKQQKFTQDVKNNTPINLQNSFQNNPQTQPKQTESKPPI